MASAGSGRPTPHASRDLRLATYVARAECRVGDVLVHYVEHGEGTPILMFHGGGVDHREADACFVPAFDAHGGLRRIYPDLPGISRTQDGCDGPTLMVAGR